MRCHEAERLIDAYLDRVLPADERRALETHLSTCPDCARRLAPLVDYLTRPAPVAVPDGLYERIMSGRRRLDKAAHGMRQRPTWLRFLMRPVGGGLAACLGVVLMGWLITTFSGAPPAVKPDPGAGPVAHPPSPQPSAWAVAGWVQTAHLPGPAIPASIVMQYLVMERSTGAELGSAPVVRIRRSPESELCVPEDETLVPRLPMILGTFAGSGV